MYYSDLYFQKKKPITVILASIAMVTMTMLFVFLFVRRSAPSTQTLKKILARHDVVNLSPHQAGIFWKTDSPTASWVVYGEKPDSLTLKSLDDRDIETHKNPYTYHYAQLPNLDENKTYYFKIFSADTIYSDLKDRPYKLTTPHEINLRSSLKPAYGTVVLPNNLPAENVFVIFNFDSYSPVLTMTKFKGEFLIPLYTLVNKSNMTMVVPTIDTPVIMEIIGDNVKSTVKASLIQLSPLSQSIILGEDYNLQPQQVILGATTVVAPTQTSVNQPTAKGQIDILYPLLNAVVPGNNPLIKGTAVPGKEVIISINSKPQYIFRALTNSKGEWKVVLTNNLIAGSYKLTLSTTDEKNKQVNVQRIFSIAKSGEQVLGDATAAPTLAISPTIEPMATPTASAYSNLTPTTPPVTGLNGTWYVLISFAFIVVGTGVLLVF